MTKIHSTTPVINQTEKLNNQKKEQDMRTEQLTKTDLSEELYEEIKINLSLIHVKVLDKSGQTKEITTVRRFTKLVEALNSLNHEDVKHVSAILIDSYDLDSEEYHKEIIAEGTLSEVIADVTKLIKTPQQTMLGIMQFIDNIMIRSTVSIAGVALSSPDGGANQLFISDDSMSYTLAEGKALSDNLRSLLDIVKTV